MNFIKRFPLFETVLVAVILIIHAYAAASDAYNLANAWFIRDDAYYYFKVAQNISEGLGSTFDGINPTNGYHPLWMLVCIPIFALARFDLILPLRVLLMVVALLNAGTAILIYRLMRRALSTPVAMLAASIWAFNGHIHYTYYEFGLETPLAAFFVLWLLDRLSVFETEWRTGFTTNRQIAFLSLLGTLAVFSRLDLVFLAVIAGIWIIFRGHPARFLMPLDLVIIFLSMASAFALRAGFPSYYLYVDALLASIVIGAVIKLPVLYFLGAYQHPRSIGLIKSIGKTALAASVSAVILTGILILLNRLNLLQTFPRAAILFDWAIGLTAMAILRIAAWWFGRPRTDSKPPNPRLEFARHWRGWLAEGRVYYGILGGALSLYMLWNRFAFGTAMPVSGQIKRWWGSMMNSLYGGPAGRWQNFFGLGVNNDFDVWKPVSFYVQRFSERMRPVMPGADRVDERFLAAFALACLIAVIILVISRRRALMQAAKLSLIPIFAGSMIHYLTYTTLDYAGTKEWYWSSQTLLLLLTASLLLDLILRPITKYRLGSVVLTLASVVLCIQLARDLGGAIFLKMPHGYFPSDRPYMEVLPIIEEATPPGAIIGMTGGGNVGYFIHDRTIVNMDGLINSYEYFQALQKGEAATYLEQKGVDVVFASPELLNMAPYNEQFARYILSYGSYGGKDFLYLLDEPKY